jgi:hypothetical protein
MPKNTIKNSGKLPESAFIVLKRDCRPARVPFGSPHRARHGSQLLRPHCGAQFMHFLFPLWCLHFRQTKNLERFSLSLLQKPSIIRYWYLKRYDEPAHTTHTILLNLASFTILYVFHLSTTPPHEFVEVAKSRFYTKKSIFRNFYIRKFCTNRYYFLVHLREEAKPSKTAYFSPPECT